MISFSDVVHCPECGSALSPFQAESSSGSSAFCTNKGEQHGWSVSNGVLLLRQPPADDLLQRYYANYDRICADDLEKPIVPNRSVFHDILLAFIGGTDGCTVLDVGSAHALYLRQMGGTRVAVDLASAYLEDIPAGAVDLRLCADVETMPLREDVFDVVIASDVLEHVLEPEAVVANIQKTLRPDGRLIIHIPWKEDISIYTTSPYEFVHLRSFDEAYMDRLFRDFTETRKLDHPPFRLFEFVQKVQRT